jgi:hypothetical protein
MAFRMLGLALGYLLSFMFAAGSLAGLFYREQYNASLLEADTGAANTQIIRWMYVEPHALSLNMFHGLALAFALAIPALMQAPRLLRMPPFFAMIALFIVNSTYLEDVYVRAATGEGIPELNIKTHAFMCTVMFIVAVMPNAAAPATKVKSH